MFKNSTYKRARTSGARSTLQQSLYAFFAVVTFFQLSCSPSYVLQAGWEEAGILLRRQDISSLVEDPMTESTLKKKLQLVLDARAFAEEHGLEPGGSFTQYTKIDRDVLVWVLSAAPKNSFTPHTWWFPIVGNVPYKGYFSKEDGVRDAKSLEAEYLDTYLRPSPAFSTLGWFDDPILSTTLAFDEVSLVNTVIHEILHSTIWMPNNVNFNETLANVVGSIGACEFLKKQKPRDASDAKEACDSWEDSLRYSQFLVTVEEELNRLYRKYDNDLSDPEQQDAAMHALLQQRATVFKRLAENWDAQAHLLKTNRFKRIDGLLNNAAFSATKTYFDRIWMFVHVYRDERCSLPKFITKMRHLVDESKKESVDPYETLAAIIDADVRRNPSSEFYQRNYPWCAEVAVLKTLTAK